jgi:aldehyde:ferredoxin oxidoreductase
MLKEEDMSQIAFVNLSSGEIDYQEIEPDLRKRFLGGRGLAAKLLFDRVGPDVAPYDPENCLIFSNGPFGGTPWPTASRYHVTFKSPATGAYGYANAGGHFAPEMARSGFEAIVITGRAPEPVYLEVTDQKISIHNAAALWGMKTTEVQNTLLGVEVRTGKNGRVLCIGPAGEKGVRVAAIINDIGRAAARGGPGAVMGSKNLKAIHAHSHTPSHSSPEFAAISRRTGKHLVTDPKNQSIMADGTVFLMRPKNLTGDLPAKNHQFAQVPFIDSIDPQALSQFFVKRIGCASCVIRCSRLSAVEDGSYLAEVEGPEYETTDALGPMVWNSDPKVLIKANALCNEYGLDAISTGVIVAFAMECHEKGLLSDPDLSLDWGDGPSIIGLIEKIGRREGIGDLLAEGTRRAAEQIGHGAEAYAMQVKGLEMPRQEPRFSKGFALGHAVANRGADHLYGLPSIDLGGNWKLAHKIFPAEIVDDLMDPDNESYKADMLIYGEHCSAVTDALGICKFSTIEEYSLMPEDLVPGLVALGIDLTTESLLETGERIVNLERLYNVREGFGRANDHLPRRFTEEPIPLRANITDPATGQTKLGEVLRTGRIKNFEGMLDRYYDLRGWNVDGHPTGATLERLDLAEEGRGLAT